MKITFSVHFENVYSQTLQWHFSSFLRQDKKADFVIHTYVDDILSKVCKRLGLEIPSYNNDEDPTKTPIEHNQEWTIQSQDVKELEKLYNAKQKAASAQRKAGKTPFTPFSKKESQLCKKKRKVNDVDNDDDESFKNKLKNDKSE